MARRAKKTKKASRSSALKSGAAKKAAKVEKRDLKPLKPPLKVRLRRRVVKTVLWLAFLVIFVPVLMTLLYRPSFVHPVSTLMISHWFQGKPVTRNWVELDDISPFVMQSVISSEDGQFCSHSGVDWQAVNLVVDDLIEGERPRGASTIPMQTVKNVYLWPSRSYVRKVLEVPLALLTDFIWGKRRMMEIYLNIAEMGPGIFGVEAAAQHHFKRSARRLTRKQAALLAVALPNPILRNPRKPKRGMQRLARLVERRAKQSGAYVKCMKPEKAQK